MIVTHAGLSKLDFVVIESKIRKKRRRGLRGATPLAESDLYVAGLTPVLSYSEMAASLESNTLLLLKR